MPNSYDNDAILGAKIERLVASILQKHIDGGLVTADAVNDLKARLESVEKFVTESNLGERIADSLDAQTLKVGGVEVKTRQSAKTNPTSSGTAISFVDSVTQNENGELTATRKSVRSATTSQTGVVQLTDSHSSTSTSTAATPKNVKEAYDLANGKADPASVVDSATYDSSSHTIVFKHGSTQLFTLDAAEFVKDGMVDSVAISNGNLVITFNTDAGKQPISIPLTDIFNPNNYYTKSAADILLASKVDSTDSRLLPDADVALILYGDITYANVMALYRAGKKLYLVTGGNIQPSGKFEYRIPLTFVTYDANLEVNAFYFEQTQNDRAGASEVGSIAVYRLDSTGWTTTPKQVGYATNAGHSSTSDTATNATNDHGGAKIRDAYLHGISANSPADQTGPEVETVTGIINVEPEVNQDGFVSAKMNLMTVSLTHVCRRSRPSLVAVNKTCSNQMPDNMARVSSNSSTAYGYSGFTVLGHVNPLAESAIDRNYGFAMTRPNWLFEVDFDFEAVPIPFENTSVYTPTIFNLIFALKYADNEFFYGFAYDDAGIFATATTTCPSYGDTSKPSYGHVHMAGLIPLNAGIRHMYLGAVQDSWNLGYIKIKVHNLQLKWITKSYDWA